MSHIQTMNPQVNDRASLRRILSIAMVITLAVIAGGFVHRASAQKISPRNKTSKFVQSSNEAANTIFQGGRDYISEEQWVKAAEKFNDYINNFPKEKNVDAALYWMAYSQYKLNRYGPAKSTLTRLLNNYKDSTWKEDAKTLMAQMPGGTPTPEVYIRPPTPEVYIGPPEAAPPEARGQGGVGIGVGRGVTLAPYFSTTAPPDRAGAATPDDDPCEFKIVVLQSLIQADVQRGIAVATEWLKPGSTQTVRCKGAALTLLARNGGKSVTPIILGVAQNETDVKLRSKAISVLGSTNDDSVIDPLRDFALNTQQNEIAEAALYALSQHTSPRAITVLSEIAMSNRPLELRKQAIAAIANRPGEPSVDALLKIYDGDQNIEIRKMAISGFSRRKSERAGAKLLEIAQSSDNIELRKYAISAIARRGGDQAVDTLLRLYDTEKNEEVKDQIINSLGYSNDPRITKKLIEIAKNPQTPIERRKRAIGWLSRSKDPEVLKFLEDLLK
jgi:HEAT repeat protein